MQRVEAALSVSISDLRKSPSSVIESAQGEPVAILNHNRIMAYMVPADVYEAMLDRLDDLALIEIAKERAHEEGVPVHIDDL
ncbi:type II toxin-antitoxin system Phd/YefM family antitoxin [Pseudaminobacter sp. 19-2017]|uniref:Antitoxin n=1 Tax=Pseudaminobacter soli (ex Zhang et al. 2022) TaxID=2831468 RepID=A0A942I1L6_9HYPH|nr:type II toxin-antitoxin system Phd/YefM family antitoxin [Pseudaminobacter soli]MBS3648257.1 type II toxin-antitoxin system Phd/YefM family antitoxin [Pseudaminobacter soli]